jgi:hypothetical protein
MSCTQDQLVVLPFASLVPKANSAESLPSFLQMRDQSPSFGSDCPLHQNPFLPPPMDLPMNYTSFTTDEEKSVQTASSLFAETTTEEQLSFLLIAICSNNHQNIKTKIEKGGTESHMHFSLHPIFNLPSPPSPPPHIVFSSYFLLVLKFSFLSDLFYVSCLVLLRF